MRRLSFCTDTDEDRKRMGFTGRFLFAVCQAGKGGLLVVGILDWAN